MTQSGSAEKVRKPRSRLVRGIYLVLGLICMGFAYMSFLPGIPTFDFVILAAFFFARSSDTFHDWLVNHRVFGRIIHAYRGGGLTVRTKVVAITGMLASLAFSGIVLTDNQVIRMILAVVGLIGIWFILSRPTRPRQAVDASPTTKPSTA